MTGTSEAAGGARRRATHVALWILQVALALVFGAVGWIKLSTRGPALEARLSWVTDVPAALVRLIGGAELLGAIGLLFPAATRIKPALTPAAAVGLATVMTLAIVFHVYRGDGVVLVVPAVLALLAAAVAVGRSRIVPITPRS